MAPALILTVAANRKVRLVRKRGQQIQDPTRLRPVHLCAVALRKHAPGTLVLRPQGCLQERFAWRKIRQPDIVEVARGDLALGDASRGTPNGTDPHALVLCPTAPKLDDPDCHSALLSVVLPSRRWSPEPSRGELRLRGSLSPLPPGFNWAGSAASVSDDIPP